MKPYSKRMFKKYFYFFLFVTGCIMFSPAFAQKSVVSSDPTLRDKFGKKIGNLMFSTATLKFGRIKNNAVQHDTIRIFNSGNWPLTLTLGKSPEHITLNLKSSSIASKTESWIAVAFDAAKKNDFGFVLDRFELITNDSVQPKKTISVTAVIEEFFPLMDGEDSLKAPRGRWSGNMYDYGKIKQGEKISSEFVVYNDGKKDMLIHKAKTNCSCIKTSISKTAVAPGDSSIIKVEFDSSGKEGKDSRKVNVYMNDYLKPDATIEMKGEVMK